MYIHPTGVSRVVVGSAEVESPLTLTREGPMRYLLAVTGACRYQSCSATFQWPSHILECANIIAEKTSVFRYLFFGLSMFNASMPPVIWRNYLADKLNVHVLMAPHLSHLITVLTAAAVACISVGVREPVGWLPSRADGCSQDCRGRCIVACCE